MADLKTIYRKSGLRQKDAACAMGVSVPTVSKYEESPWKMRMDEFAGLYKALGTDSKAMLMDLLAEELG